MPKTRRTFSQEFKEEAVQLVTKQGYTVARAAANLGISENMLWRWKKDVQQKEENPTAASQNEELQRLQKENKELRMERDILKKAAAFFAKDSLNDTRL